MKLSKRGFTLIELLAVIVVLAIIALVATPLILGVVEKAKKGAAESSALSWVNAVENQIAINLVDTDDTNNIPDGVITVSDLLSTYGVSVKGKIPASSGTTTITNGKVTALNVEIDGYSITYDPATGKATAGGSSSNNSSTPVATVTITDKSVTSLAVGSTLTLSATKANTDSEITWTSSDTSVATVENGVVTPVAAGNTTITASAGGVSDTLTIKVYENIAYNVSDIIYFDPVNNTSCNTYTSANSLNETKTGCMKWYVIKDNGSSVDVLLDHNTKYQQQWYDSSVNVAYESSLIKPYIDDLVSTTGWAVQPRLIEATEINEITGNPSSWEWDASNYNSWYYFDNKFQSQNPLGKSGSAYAWLFDNTSYCEAYGCNTQDDSSGVGYWTATPLGDYGSGTSLWSVENEGYMIDVRANSSGRGIRPVVTIQKSNL